jgi:hypothetical protein
MDKFFEIWSDKWQEPHTAYEYNVVDYFIDNQDKIDPNPIFFCLEEEDLGDSHKREELIKKCNKLNLNFTFIYGGSKDYTHELDFYNKQSNGHCYPGKHVFWDLAWLYKSAINFQDNYPMISVEDRKNIHNPKYHFLSMNSNPRYYRCRMVDLLYKNNLNKDNLITWHLPENPQAQNYEWKYFDNTYQNNFDDKFERDPEGWPYVEKLPVRNSYELPDEYYNSAFQVVSETSLNTAFYTEKTFIPLFLGKPFIIFASPYSNLKLRKYGFKLYDQIFNYDFDKILWWEARVEAYVKEIKRVTEKYSPEDIYNILRDTAQYKRKVAIDILRNKKFIPKELTQIWAEYKNEILFNTSTGFWLNKAL